MERLVFLIYSEEMRGGDDACNGLSEVNMNQYSSTKSFLWYLIIAYYKTPQVLRAVNIYMASAQKSFESLTKSTSPSSLISSIYKQA